MRGAAAAALILRCVVTTWGRAGREVDPLPGTAAVARGGGLATYIDRGAKVRHFMSVALRPA